MALCDNVTYNGCSIRVSMLPYPPYSFDCAYKKEFFETQPSPIFFQKSRRKLGCLFPGFEIEYFFALAWILNITLEWVPPVNSEFGNSINGSFDGLIGMLQRNEIDMSLGTLSIQPEMLGGN